MSAFLLNRNAQAAEAPKSVRVTLGHAVIALNGPWKFHTGDDARWADPNFDDSEWETVDLTPKPKAHDSDVGLNGYVPGWEARGHPGYFGYAWYRIRVSMDTPRGETLALNGPFYVDSAYQVFLNGQCLGGAGDFSRNPPVAYNSHFPEIFPLRGRQEGEALIAMRVYMGPWALGASDGGGIHIAPAIGTSQGAESLFQQQWFEMIRGYIVDAIEALVFLFLAAMVCTLIPFDRSNQAYLWMAGALVLIALARGNQAVFFWWQFETIHGFELATVVLFVPLSLAAWTIAWCHWFNLRQRSWMPAVAGVVTLLYVASQFLRRSWFYGVFPHWLSAAASYGVTWSRLLLVLMTLLIVFRVAAQSGRGKWLGLAAILLISIGLFAQELSSLRVPGIWFPFGTGVSRTEYAYAGFDVALFLLLLQRLYALNKARF